MGNRHIITTLGPNQQVLYHAAEAALAAPSIFNTQPWAWTVRGERLELRADRSRQLASVDPSGRLLTVSCGVALHHAVTAISGYTPHAAHVSLLPDATDPDLFAVLRLADPVPPDRRSGGLLRAIATRRTDRRPFQKVPIDGADLDRLVVACARQNAHLYVVPWHQVSTLALAAVAAGALQLADPQYRAELADWTHRPAGTDDGVPVESAVERIRRRVPVRDFAPLGGDVLPAGPETDYGVTYGIIHTDADTVHDWLAAGMGLSAVLLTATAAGLASATISDVTEATMVREHLGQLLPSGHPQVAVRVGIAQPGELPATPRRPTDSVVTVLE